MNDPVSSLIVRQLDLAAARHKVLAHNLANYGTPDYAVKGESFEGALEKAKTAKAAGQDRAAATAGQAAGSGDAAGAATDDAVSAGATPQETAEGLEMQMARLADNTGRFSALARLLSVREKTYENAIRGR